MHFPSIDIQGAILSADLLSKIRSEQASYQQGKDFDPELSNAKLKDEISLVWREVRDQWNIFKSKKARLKDDDNGTTETRNFWIVPLLTNLGYNLSFSKSAEEINGKVFPIGFRDTKLDGFPVYVGSFKESLDRRPESKLLRVSPHAMVQEYLNHSEHLYGLVTNGHQLRLLRDASRITRLSYVEFNLEKMMEEDLYADFVILYRLLHASRMPKRMGGGAESIIDKYHLESLEAGSTIRSKLGDAVKMAIQSLANGFINHPNNVALREAVASPHFSAEEYYRHQLRIIYRLLFLFVIEERNLVYGASKSPETKRFNQIYTQHFSLMRLRKKAKQLLPPEAARHHDLWQGLITTFSLFEKKEIGEKLGIMALQGDLFGYHAIQGQGYDLHHCQLSNAELLNILKSLSYFENEQGVLIAVNYGGLDVEEFGSVYEGLLELKLDIQAVPGSNRYSCSFNSSNERSKSGSHYTPEELVQPLIKHSLDYLIADKLKEPQPEQALLTLKVADVACGSGHILLSASRRIAHELACLVETRESNSREKVEQPSPTYMRKAMKEVVRHCIYGVDKNPLAVELCKIALWLEAYNPGEPLNFLDHHIKCGDAIVGLAHRSELQKGIADEAFKTLPGDDKDIAKSWRDRNSRERKSREPKGLQLQYDYDRSADDSLKEAINDYKAFTQLPEGTPEQIEQKAKAYKRFIEGKGYGFLKTMADTQVAQFFIPKTEANKDSIITDADFRQILAGYKGWQDRRTAKACVVAQEKRFFHWFIEFPEVFGEGGFSCVLGNPPFLGDKKLKSSFGESFIEVAKFLYKPIGAVELVTYFLRRIFDIIQRNGFVSIISTNTIAQGNSREDGLEIILQKEGKIIHAVKSIKWPGKAAVEVSLISIHKGAWSGVFHLNSKQVSIITALLDESTTVSTPFTLKENENKSFIGSYVLGNGFLLEPNHAFELIQQNPSNKNVLFPFLNGEDLNNDPRQNPSRWVINFFGWPERRLTNSEWNELTESEQEEIFNRIKENKTLLKAPPKYEGDVASDYPQCYQIALNLVKPDRQRWATDKKGAPIIGQYAIRSPMPQRWWIYGEKRPGLYNKIKKNQRVLVIALTSKTVAFCFVPNGIIYSHATVVIADERSSVFAILQSGVHRLWVDTFSSRMKTDQRYTPSDCFENYPFPKFTGLKIESTLEKLGTIYHENRSEFMINVQLGLTKTYNLFHSNAITSAAVNEKDKQVISLQKHLEKTEGAISFEAAIAGIIQLRALHVEMDQAVLEAYGWSDISLRHDFYEVDYLPENDRIRYTIHPDARKEILKRLLALNHQIHAEEVAQGLWEKKKAPAKGKQKEKKKDEGYGGLFELEDGAG